MMHGEQRTTNWESHTPNRLHHRRPDAYEPVFIPPVALETESLKRVTLHNGVMKQATPGVAYWVITWCIIKYKDKGMMANCYLATDGVNKLAVLAIEQNPYLISDECTVATSALKSHDNFDLNDVLKSII